jgi:hypothetical protein
MACERPPACRFAPRLSPFVRGTIKPASLNRTVSPYEGGQPRSEATGRGSLTSHVIYKDITPVESPK